jgi:hypothetical protein
VPIGNPASNAVVRAGERDGRVHGMLGVASTNLPARAHAVQWKETTWLELVWKLSETLDDDAAVVRAVTDLARRGRLRSEDGRLYRVR